MANGSTVKGFNLTGSGHCGCGSAGIQVASSNNTVLENIIYKNKYGIYVKPENFNNTFVSNDLLQNEIAAYDPGNNSWNSSLKAEGLQKLVELVVGKQMKGNHYSDYDEPEEGCNDTNKDGFCDLPRKIDGGNSVDLYPSFSKGKS
jgi:parallel beta-helix repeat protein